VTGAAQEHLERLVRSWLGVGAATGVPELPEPLARRLLRLEEQESAHRDQWGNWEFAFCESFREGRLWEPDVDRWVAERRRELAASTALEPLWPDGRPFAVCLTHDVDLVSPVSTPRQALRSLRLGLADRGSSRREAVVGLARPAVRAARVAVNGIAASPAADTLERSVELERERGVRASYLFTVYPGAAGSRFDCVYEFADACTFRGGRTTIRDVLGLLDDEGFDVGLHGSYRSALEPGLLAREKAALERATSLTVRSTRQHFLHWHVATTPRLQAEAGLAVDSTLGFNRNLGFRTGTSLPFHPFDLGRGEPLDLLEVPLVVHDAALLRPDALELDVELARAAVEQLLDRAAELGGVATLSFHPNNFEHDAYLDLYRFALDRGLERGGWFTTLRGLDAWWRERERRLQAA
jgi:hypothetical protein